MRRTPLGIFVLVQRNLRTVLVCTLVLFVVVSGTLTSPVPPVHACNAAGCSFLLTWGSFGSGNGQFVFPSGVAVDAGGNVYVADYTNNRVEKFTSTGTYISQLGCASGACSHGSLDGQFSHPYGVAVDSGGNVYVADSANNRVENFTGGGVFVGWAGACTGGVNCVGGLHSNGFQCTASTCTGVGTTGSGNGQFKGPYGVAVDSAGNVYVTDFSNSRVEKFTGTGTFATTWGTTGTGNGNFNGPRGVAVDSLGYVYVADASNDRVEKFTSTGAFILTWGSVGSGNGQFLVPAGIAVDSSGNVYVVDKNNNRVEKFTGTGTFITTWGSSGSGNGQFITPEAVTVDAGGNVYVADYGNNRVELFGLPVGATSASISLVVGWNLISLPLVPLDTGITKVLSDLIVANNFTIVWFYNGGAWTSFNPTSTKPCVSFCLTNMYDGFGYWIYVTHPSKLLVLGFTIPPPPFAWSGGPSTYHLSSGWNLVGFRPQSPTQNETLGRYLTSISGDYLVVQIYNNTSTSWTLASSSTWIVPGQAMWIYMTSSATLVPE